MPSINSIARSAYDLAFQVSPIVLTGGIVQNAPGAAMPIIGLVGQLAGFAQGALSSGLSMNDFWARFVPIPGSTVIANTVGTYPFANQYVAANAIITQPLNVSLMMIAPVKEALGYITKLPIFTALRSSLAAHNAAAGTYTIATPSYIYTNCIMTNMSDITSGESRQQQITWQLDFTQPLISASDAQHVFNALTQKMQSGQQSQASLSAAAGAPAQGANAIPGVAGNIVQYMSQPVSNLLP